MFCWLQNPRASPCVLLATKHSDKGIDCSLTKHFFSADSLLFIRYGIFLYFLQLFPAHQFYNFLQARGSHQKGFASHWKYFGVEISCGRRADDTRVRFRARFHWKTTYVICTSSGSVYVVHTLSDSWHIVHTRQQLCIKPTGFLVTFAGAPKAGVTSEVLSFSLIPN